MKPRGAGERVSPERLRELVEEVADQLCRTVDGDFDLRVETDAVDDSIEKLQLLVNLALDRARRTGEERRRAKDLEVENLRLRQNLAERRLGSYQLESLLGRGGMGEVWRARHDFLARPAAVKVISPEVLGIASSTTASILERFHREARATASLRSPHTVAVYDFGESAGRFYYVMELLSGLDLRTLVQRHGPLPPARVVHLLRQVCHSLAEAHARGLVHRDLKPANLFACRYGLELDFIKVLDFGLVKTVGKDDAELTGIGVIPGTPAFLAPETITGGRVDARADVYSLGCTAYWLLTGENVFETDSALSAALRHVQEAPIPPSSRIAGIPRSLDDLVLRCLSKLPAERPADGAAVLAEFERLSVEGWVGSPCREWWARHEPSTESGSRGDDTFLVSPPS